MPVPPKVRLLYVVPVTDAVVAVYWTVLVPEGVKVPVTMKGVPGLVKVIVPEVGARVAEAPIVRTPVTV